MTVCLSGRGKNSDGQVNNIGTFSRRLKFCIFSPVYISGQSGTDKNNGGQVDLFNTFPREKQNFSIISTPDITDNFKANQLKQQEMM